MTTAGQHTASGASRAPGQTPTVSDQCAVWRRVIDPRLLQTIQSAAIYLKLIILATLSPRREMREGVRRRGEREDEGKREERLGGKERGWRWGRKRRGYRGRIGGEG